MNKNGLWAYIINNIVCVVCWAVLAFIFNRWWIALFAFLFIVFPKYLGKYYRICDKCGRHSSYANTPNEAIKKAKEHGWITIGYYDDWDTCNDICPECQTKN